MDAENDGHRYAGSMETALSVSHRHHKLPQWAISIRRINLLCLSAEEAAVPSLIMRQIRASAFTGARSQPQGLFLHDPSLSSQQSGMRLLRLKDMAERPPSLTVRDTGR